LLCGVLPPFSLLAVTWYVALRGPDHVLGLNSVLGPVCFVDCGLVIAVLGPWEVSLTCTWACLRCYVAQSVR